MRACEYCKKSAGRNTGGPPGVSDNDTSCLADYTFTMPFGSFYKTTQGNLGNVFKLVYTLLRSAIFKHLIVASSVSDDALFWVLPLNA